MARIARVGAARRSRSPAGIGGASRVVVFKNLCPVLVPPGTARANGREDLVGAEFVAAPAVSQSKSLADQERGRPCARLTKRLGLSGCPEPIPGGILAWSA